MQKLILETAPKLIIAFAGIYAAYVGSNYTSAFEEKTRQDRQQILDKRQERYKERDLIQGESREAFLIPTVMDELWDAYDKCRLGTKTRAECANEQNPSSNCDKCCLETKSECSNEQNPSSNTDKK